MDIASIAGKDPAYFIDMDGVLARYERRAYDKSRGPEPGVALFEHEPSHYFRYCEPDPVAIAMLDALLLIRNAKIFVMTSVAEHIPWAAEDKKIWLSAHCPGIDVDTQLVIACRDKPEMARKALNADRLGRNAYLIDDFNKNLAKWEREGGKGVKYLNGVNSASSWDGLVIDGRPGGSGHIRGNAGIICG